MLRPVIFFITGFCTSQNVQLNEVEGLINRLELDSALVKIQLINKDSISIFEQGLLDYYQGVIYKKKDKFPIGFDKLINSVKIFNRLDSFDHKADVDYEIYDLLNQQNTLKIDPTPFLDAYIDYSKRSKDTLKLARSYAKIAGVHWDKDDFDNAKKYFRRSLDELHKLNDIVRIAQIETNLGSINVSDNNSDSALYYYNRTLPIFIQRNETNKIANNYNNLARAYEVRFDTVTAVDYYKKALQVNIKENIKKSKAIYLTNLIRSYGTLKDYPNAFKFAEELIALNIEIDDQSQNEALIDAENKYRASEKDKQRLRNQNIAIALGGGLLTVSLIAFLLFKNTKKKQRIAEQEKELEIQKTEKLLKEQELTTIDAMIEGQEKERQRLAGDLHDSVGATLSAARLQFDHISKNKDQLGKLDELIEKTGSLLDDAYNEVRSMAHLKNSGVIAKNGLLPAVEKLAKNASGTNKLKVEVEDFGLENRLENTLEITIFRIIQELVTNVIKHANASEATISITQHQDSLNIIVEDNGKGFDAQKFQQKEGMGLSGIERRIEHLEGTLEVDSTLGKGTSVLIDIPL